MYKRQYDYDAWGNRALEMTGGASVSAGVPRTTGAFDSNNRITGFLYDYVGNTTQMTVGVTAQMGYDAQNLQTSYANGSVVTTYYYDADKHRVKRVVSGAPSHSGLNGTTTYVYDAFGMLAAEYRNTSPTAAEKTLFRTTDHLGSTRLVTDSTGEIASRTDFLPFGEEIDVSSGDARYGITGFDAGNPLTQRFTAKERDQESGLDYFLARYYGSSLGRFTSVDPGNAGATVANPQTWNGYAYVNNNPTAFVDPNGESATFFGALGGGIIGGAVAAYRGEDISTGVLKGAVAGALAGSVIDTGGASLAVIAASGAVGGGSAVALDQTFAGQDVNATDVAKGAAIGAVAGPVVAKA